ncbi:MAG: ribbon-helix-helix protein, CopG family [Anaerolineales bacterium]
MVRTQIQLSEKQSQALKKLAARRKVSVAELIREAVDEQLRSAGKIDPDERKRRALAAAGRFHSGQTDLSTEHDQYLAEAFGA